MSLVIAWLVFPAVLGVLALGCGLALERAARTDLPGTLLLPAGLAGIIVVGGLVTATDATAELAAPLVVVLAAAGLAISPPWEQRRRFEGPALAAAAAVFAVFAAPVVLSGHATFAGYIKLDDTATFLALTDRIMEHGRSLAGLSPSSYEATLANNLGAYPVGSFLPLGVGATLLDQDPAWLWQPWLGCLAAVLSLTIDALLRPLVPRAQLRALCAFVAAQPSLLFGYAMWGGTKELATAWIVALVAAMMPITTRAGGPREALPLAVATAATLAIVSFAGGVWIALPLAATIFVAARMHGRRRALRLTAGLAVLSAVLALPSLLVAKDFLAQFTGGAKLLTSESDIGNLFGRISELQILGVWPSGDFRVDPADTETVHVLMAVVAIAAAVGLAAAAMKRGWAFALYVVGTTAAGLAIALGSGPWVAAKALAVASPAVLVAATAGAAYAWLRGKRVEAVVVGAAVAGGMLWSNVLTYREVTLAPRDQFVELERIGRRAAGRGPTLMTEYNPYGARHFLRDADGEGVSELRRRVIPLRTGRQAPKGAAVDTDDLQLAGLLEYRTLVLRRSPVASRPPAAYELAERGDAYEMWQRHTAFVAPREHLPLGGPLSPSARPRCEDVHRLATLAGPAGVLAAVRRKAPVVAELGRLAPVPGWDLYPGSPGVVYPNGNGTLLADVSVPAPEEYRVWLGGSIHGHLSVEVDGRAVGGARGVVNAAGGYLALGTVRLPAGPHRVAITHKDGGWRPGAAAQEVLPLPIGPLVLSPATDARGVEYVPSSDWRRLCGEPLDWVEAVPG